MILAISKSKTKSQIFNSFHHKNVYGTNITQENKSLPLDAAVLRNEGTNAGAFTFGMKGFAFTLSECSRAFRSLVSSLVSPGPGSSKESHESGAFASELLGSIPWSWLLEDILIDQDCNIFFSWTHEKWCNFHAGYCGIEHAFTEPLTGLAEQAAPFSGLTEMDSRWFMTI